MPIIEIAEFAASEALLADPNIITPALDFLIKVDGCLGIYHGIAEEDKKTIFLIIVWETFEHHKALLDDPEFPGIIGLGPSIFPDEIKVTHVKFIQDPFPALSAPTTEIVYTTLKEGKTQEDLYEVLTVLASKLDVDAPYPPIAWGESLQEPGKRCGIVLGWNNSKEHFDLVERPSYATPIQNLFNTVDLKMFHAALKKHSA